MSGRKSGEVGRAECEVEGVRRRPPHPRHRPGVRRAHDLPVVRAWVWPECRRREGVSVAVVSSVRAHHRHQPCRSHGSGRRLKETAEKNMGTSSRRRTATVAAGSLSPVSASQPS